MSVLTATYLAKSWISASAQPSYMSASYLPSTPQYLLAVGNLGIPSLVSFWKSSSYFFRRRTHLSPVFAESAIVLAALIFTATMITIGDIWIHFSSTAVLEQNVLTTSGLNDFSRDFATPENAITAPWRLQQGLQTFLNVNPISTVIDINDTMVIVPVDIPANRAVVGSTIGMHLDCSLVNLNCIFNQNSNPIQFDCSQFLPGATGSFTNNVNVTLYPTKNSTSFQLLAAMALPSVFNVSTTVAPIQVFHCSGSLENVTYSGVNNDFSILTANAIDTSPLKTLWNLGSFAGKQEVIENALSTVGTSTILVEGMNVTTLPSVFGEGLSRVLISFLSGQTIPTRSIMVSYLQNNI